MRLLSNTRAVLAFSALTAFVSVGLPVAPTSSTPARAPAGTRLLLRDGQDRAGGCPGLPPAQGENCVPLPVQILRKEHNEASTCSAIVFMQVPLIDSVVQYDATWAPPNEPASPRAFTASGGPNGTGSGPFGDEEYWSTKEISYYGIIYKVPKGFGAWLLGAGGGPAPCTNLGPGVAQAWGWTAHPVVSGKVTLEGPGGQPAAGVAVRASCPSGGTTASDAMGDYGFVLGPGPCTIAPQLQGGATATPKQRVVDVTAQDINNVDFQVPCGALVQGANSGSPTAAAYALATPGPAGDGRRSVGARAGRQEAALTPAASSPAACLQVFIKIVGPIPNVGTRSGLSVDNYVPDQGSANFTRVVYSKAASPLVAAGEEGQQCVSGCANIVVTVVNKVTHKRVKNAEVNVELGAIDTEGSPNLHQQGTQFLCPQTDSPTRECGTSLDRLKADDNGQVRLLYWAPGELVAAHVELYAQACTPAACALKRAKSKITVYPYRIFHYQGELKPEDVATLVEMVREHGYFDIASHAAEQGLEATAKAWMELLGVESDAVELALGPIGFFVAFTIIDVTHLTSELLEEAALRGAFFEASGLSGAGLAAGDPFAKVVGSSDAVYFEGMVLHGGTLFTYPSGWLSELGKQLAAKYPYHTFHTLTDVKPEPLDLSVYETSYCSQSTQMVPGLGGVAVYQKSPQQATCGFGYSSARNIRTDLCFILNSNSLEPHCGIQYDAPIWVVSQEGVDKHLNHPGALNTKLP